MKKLLAIAALLFASTTAQAQYTIDYGGRTIRIDPDRGTVQIPGVYDNTPKAKRSRNEDGDRDRPRKQSPQQTKTDSKAAPDTVVAPAAPAPAEQAAVPTAPAPVPAAPPPPGTSAPLEPSTATVAVGPAEPVTAPPAPPPPSAPAPQVRQEPPPAPKPAVAAVTPPPAPPPPAPQAANSPLGVWLTEEKEGKVRIEQCGANLCGYSVDKKSNRNGEQVLINMKPGRDNKWSGRIFDPNSGSNYDSTIAMKGDSLRVQGCAFGGMFCGGQTWTRVN
jgi:uncharacterized protein (DUF2147 family)